MGHKRNGNHKRPPRSARKRRGARQEAKREQEQPAARHHRPPRRYSPPTGDLEVVRLASGKLLARRVDPGDDSAVKDTSESTNRPDPMEGAN